MRRYFFLGLLLSFLTPAVAQKAVYVVTNNVGLYEKPDQKTKPFLYLPIKEKLIAYDVVGVDNPTWQYVRYINRRKEEYEGYVLKKYITDKKESIKVQESVARSGKTQVVVNDVDINQLPHVKYCEIVGTNVSLLGKRLVINLDYGQKFKWGTTQRIKDVTGRNKKFNSMVDALNFMIANGWEYVNSYTVTTGKSPVYHYLLRRK